jgi:hypothetical protein
MISPRPARQAKTARTSMGPRKKEQAAGDRPVSLKILADYLGLCPATVSVVLNNVPGRSIPHETRERVRAAARKFNYQPSLLARSLRKQRTFTVGVLVPELSDGYHTLVMSGIGDHLMREGYFYFSAHHRHKPDLIEEYPRLLLGHGVEGIIAIDFARTPTLRSGGGCHRPQENSRRHQCGARSSPRCGTGDSPSPPARPSPHRLHARAAVQFGFG